MTRQPSSGIRPKDTRPKEEVRGRVAPSRQAYYAVAPQQDKTPWREVLPVHPAAELFPRMSEEELNVLVQDIRRHGLKRKITLWNDGTIDYVLDGINRLDALERAGAQFFATETHDGRRLPDSKYFFHLANPALDPYAYVISANIHRRHLTTKQKRVLIAKLLKAKPEASNVIIAKQAKADDKTVANVRRELEGRSEIPNVEMRTDAKGRRQPATKRTTQPRRSATEKATARAAMPVELDAIAESRRTDQMPSRKATATKDSALIGFNELVLDLLRRVSKHHPDRFAKTSVEADDLGKLGKFFADLAQLKPRAAS